MGFDSSDSHVGQNNQGKPDPSVGEIMAGKEGGYLHIWQEATDSERKEHLIELEDKVIRKAPENREELFKGLES